MSGNRLRVSRVSDCDAGPEKGPGRVGKATGLLRGWSMRGSSRASVMPAPGGCALHPAAECGRWWAARSMESAAGNPLLLVHVGCERVNIRCCVYPISPRMVWILPALEMSPPCLAGTHWLQRGLQMARHSLWLCPLFSPLPLALQIWVLPGWLWRGAAGWSSADPLGTIRPLGARVLLSCVKIASRASIGARPQES